jgi:hypothetical protein
MKAAEPLKKSQTKVQIYENYDIHKARTETDEEIRHPRS